MKASKVQTLRGLACCCLLVYHVIGATAAQSLRAHDGWMRELTEALVAVRMPVFGLLAGALYGFSNKRGWALVRHKAARLLLPMFSVLGATYLFPYFLLGLGLTRLQWDPQQQRRKTGVLFSGLGAALVGWLMWQRHELDRFSAPVLLAGLLLSAGLWCLGWRNALLARIGDYSFVIFLFHAFFTSATRMVLQALVHDTPGLVLAVSLPVGVLVPVFLQWLMGHSNRCSTLLLGAPPAQGAVA